MEDINLRKVEVDCCSNCCQAITKINIYCRKFGMLVQSLQICDFFKKKENEDEN